jgi:hypothetical protein
MVCAVGRGTLALQLDVVGDESAWPPARTSRRPWCAGRRRGRARRRWPGTRSRSRRCGRCRAVRPGPEPEARESGPSGSSAGRLRRLAKPEFISPLTERQCGAGEAVGGQQPGLGALTSSRYCAMARVFQTRAPSWVRQGTRIDGASSSSSRRASASSAATITSVEGRGRQSLHEQPPAQRPGRVVFAAEGEARDGSGRACRRARGLACRRRGLAAGRGPFGEGRCAGATLAARGRLGGGRRLGWRWEGGRHGGLQDSPAMGGPFIGASAVPIGCPLAGNLDGVAHGAQVAARVGPHLPEHA